MLNIYALEVFAAGAKGNPSCSEAYRYLDSPNKSVADHLSKRAAKILGYMVMMVIFKKRNFAVSLI